VHKDTRGAPELVPLLSAGKHRNQRKGACFMEFASYLAGERWTDRPRCTHPLLAELAREVNDHVDDQHRQRLLPLIPSVIGLTSDDPHVDVGLALLAASAALPIAPEPDQRALAVAILTGGRVRAALDAVAGGEPGPDCAAMLDAAPGAERWARRFTDGRTPGVHGYQRYAAPHAVRVAVRAISRAVVPDPDRRLCDLLEQAVAQFPGWAGLAAADRPARVESTA
jgi:hypothetical protein